jgi:hypothetical protein
MNKLIIIGGLLLASLTIEAQSLSPNQVRLHYMQALKRRSALDSLHRVLSSIKSPTPFEESYLGICTGMQAQYADGIWAKYRMAALSKSYLNRAVERDGGKDAELRFLRYTYEYYLPSYLLMSSHMTSDLNYVFAHINFLSDLPEVKKTVLEFILSTHRCTPEQTRIAETILVDIKKRLAELKH